MIERPTTPATSTVAKPARRRRPAAADALADLREDVEEDEARAERLEDRARDELAQVLAQHHEVAQAGGAEARPGSTAPAASSATSCEAVAGER